MTVDERKNAFMADLKAVLAKHNADIYLDEINVKAYMGGNWVMAVTLDSVYDSDGECVAQYDYFNIGNYIDGND